MKENLPLALSVIAGLTAMGFDIASNHMMSRVMTIIATGLVLYYLVVQYTKRAKKDVTSDIN